MDFGVGEESAFWISIRESLICRSEVVFGSKFRSGSDGIVTKYDLGAKINGWSKMAQYPYPLSTKLTQNTLNPPETSG